MKHNNQSQQHKAQEEQVISSQVTLTAKGVSDCDKTAEAHICKNCGNRDLSGTKLVCPYCGNNKKNLDWIKGYKKAQQEELEFLDTLEKDNFNDGSERMKNFYLGKHSVLDRIKKKLKENLK